MKAKILLMIALSATFGLVSQPVSLTQEFDREKIDQEPDQESDISCLLSASEMAEEEKEINELMENVWSFFERIAHNKLPENASFQIVQLNVDSRMNLFDLAIEDFINVIEMIKHMSEAGCSPVNAQEFEQNAFLVDEILKDLKSFIEDVKSIKLHHGDEIIKPMKENLKTDIGQIIEIIKMSGAKNANPWAELLKKTSKRLVKMKEDLRQPEFGQKNAALLKVAIKDQLKSEKEANNQYQNELHEQLIHERNERLGSQENMIKEDIMITEKAFYLPDESVSNQLSQAFGHLTHAIEVVKSIDEYEWKSIKQRILNTGEQLEKIVGLAEDRIIQLSREIKYSDPEQLKKTIHDWLHMIDQLNNLFGLCLFVSFEDLL